MPEGDARDTADLFRRPPDRFIHVGEGEVACRSVGTGPHALFVHGWPVSGATYRTLLPYLTSRLTCHVVDLVGAGQSRFDRSSRIDLALHVASLRKVVETLGLGSFAVVGHDSGGLIARHAFAGDPRLRGMALIDTEQLTLGWRFRQFLAMARLPGFEHALVWAAMQPRLRRSSFLLGGCFADPALLDGEFEDLFLAPLRDDPDRRWAAGQLGRTFDLEYCARLGEVHARLAAPVQLVWGEGDIFFPVERAREMVSSFPNAALHVVSGARLFAHEERPEEVAAAIRPTLLQGASVPQDEGGEHHPDLGDGARHSGAFTQIV
ncbi:MAG: alpha/beta hydrolase [Deltaproteobacteria bacterium]|nr:alpha/beta hydrolase [Deltaproteobacteria bacterium]